MKKLGKIKLQQLSIDQMKSIKGGATVCFSSNGRYFSTDSSDVGNAWCYVWEGFGYQCNCHSNSGGYYLYC